MNVCVHARNKCGTRTQGIKNRARNMVFIRLTLLPGWQAHLHSLLRVSANPGNLGFAERCRFVVVK